METPSKSEAREFYWRNGIVAAFYLRPSQLEVYEFISNNHRPFIEAARRWGKTTTVLAYVFEFLLRNPGAICRIALPWKDQARKVWLPEIEKMQLDCPEEIRFKYHTMDSVCVAPNGSLIYLVGTNEDRGRSARGTATALAICDEVGFWSYPEVIQEVLAPQLRTTKGKLILCSTPPNDLGHWWYEEKKISIAQKRCIQKTIYDDESLFDGSRNCLDQKTFEQIVKDCGGLTSPTFLREYLCEPVSDPQKLVIPEYNETIHVVSSYPTPEYFDSYVGCDLGLNDFTALLFGFYDFTHDTIVIQDEMVVSGWNSKQITDRAKQIELTLWGNKPPYLRYSDNELQQLHDMNTLFGYQMIPTRKDDKLSAINQLRDRFAKGKIKILEKCEVTRFQLKVGLWNDQRTNYLRSHSSSSSSTGHLDAIDALIYLNRNIDIRKNPYPKWVGVTPETHFINPELMKEQELTSSELALKNAFSFGGGKL